MSPFVTNKLWFNIPSTTDFEKLSYDEGPDKVIARLQLLISPACKSLDAKGTLSIVEMKKSVFQLIKDDGHESCGYVSKEM